MKNRTRISWADYTFNPWEGCTKVSAGCALCYAEARNQRWHEGIHWGPGAARRDSLDRTIAMARQINRRFDPRTGDLTMLEDAAGQRWVKQREQPFGEPTEPIKTVRPQAFTLSLGDILDPEIPAGWLGRWIATMHECANLEWLVLTKRPERFQDRLMAACRAGGPIERMAIHLFLDHPPRHVAWGTSVENDLVIERADALAKIPAERRFISAEPLIGPVDLGEAFERHPGAFHLVISGGESGVKARPMHPHWPARIHEHCRLAGVPHHFKQWGTWAPASLVPLEGPADNAGNRVVVADPMGLADATMHRAPRKGGPPPTLWGKPTQPRLRFPTR